HGRSHRPASSHAHRRNGPSHNLSAARTQLPFWSTRVAGADARSRRGRLLLVLACPDHLGDTLGNLPESYSRSCDGSGRFFAVGGLLRSDLHVSLPEQQLRSRRHVLAILLRLYHRLPRTLAKTSRDQGENT